MSSIGEWLAHPSGGPLRRERLPKQMLGFLDATPEPAQMVQQMPLGKMRMFPGGLDAGALAQLVEEANGSGLA